MEGEEIKTDWVSTAMALVTITVSLGTGLIWGFLIGRYDTK